MRCASGPKITSRFISNSAHLVSKASIALLKYIHMRIFNAVLIVWRASAKRPRLKLSAEKSSTWVVYGIADSTWQSRSELVSCCVAIPARTLARLQERWGRGERVRHRRKSE